MTTPDRAALGERAARALSAWGLDDGFDKLHALIVEWGVVELAIECEAAANRAFDAMTRLNVDYRHEIRDAIRARGTESKTGGR